MSEKKDSVSDIIGVIVLFLFLGFEIVLAALSLFAGHGAENDVNREIFMFSAIFGLFGAILILLSKLGRWIVILTKQENKVGWINCILHDVDTSFIPVNKKGFTWIKNPFILALACLIPASILGVVQVYQGTFWSEIPKRVVQQINPVAESILSTIPSDMEIYLPIAITGLLISLTIWLVKKNKISKETSYPLIYMGIPIVYTLIWLGDHLLHHGDSDLAIRYVMLFGIISAYLLVIFRSLIPVLIFKITNNLYQYLNGAIGSDETILFITIGANILVIGLLIYIFSVRAKNKQGETT